MKHQVGDLLWIPQAVMLYKGSNAPMAVKFNGKPCVGIFLKETGHAGYALILVEGQEWIVDKKQIKKMRTKERHAC